MNVESRLLDAINALCIADRGTLWYVKDTVWEKAIKNFIRKRKGHPGLVISKRKFTSLQDTVSILIGSSHYSGGCFSVLNVMPYSGKAITFFNPIRPCPISKAPSPFAVENFTGQSDEIQRNHMKPRLNGKEMRDLNNYLKIKGLES